MGRLRLAGVCLVMSLLFGCYPNGPEYVNDLDLVVTRYDKSFDFKKDAKTYAIPNDVVKITGNLINGEEVEFIDDEYASIIINSIKDNLDAYGWTEAQPGQADVLILPSAMSSTTFLWYYDWWYWDWWYPYDWWGWYYPYPIWGYGGSYTSGSVFLQMTYPEGITAADNIPVPWAVVLNGLLEGSTSQIQQRIEKGIDQAFKQSPYLDID